MLTKIISRFSIHFSQNCLVSKFWTFIYIDFVTSWNNVYICYALCHHPFPLFFFLANGSLWWATRRNAFCYSTKTKIYSTACCLFPSILTNFRSRAINLEERASLPKRIVTVILGEFFYTEIENICLINNSLTCL